jgi:hypothetical protein
MPFQTRRLTPPVMEKPWILFCIRGWNVISISASGPPL